MTQLSSYTIAILRNCNLTAGHQSFVRCRVPGEKLSNAQQRAAYAAEKELNEPGVFVSTHPDYGDYLRVNHGTAAYRLICWMKS